AFEQLPLLLGECHGRRLIPGTQEIIALRIRPALEAGPPPRIAFARQEKLAEAVWPPERIEHLQQFDYGVGAQLGSTMHQGVMAGRENTQIAVDVRDLEPLAKRLDQGHTRFLVAMVTGPLFG